MTPQLSNSRPWLLKPTMKDLVFVQKWRFCKMPSITGDGEVFLEFGIWSRGAFTAGAMVVYGLV